MTDTITPTLTAPAGRRRGCRCRPGGGRRLPRGARPVAGGRRRRARRRQGRAGPGRRGRVAPARGPADAARWAGPPVSSGCSPRCCATVAYLEVIIDHAAAHGHPAAAGAAPTAGAHRPGRRLLREQLPVRLLGGRRRHRLRPGRRLPRRGQGALGSPRALPRGPPRWSAAALAEAGAPDGIFGLIEGTEAGRVLIQDPAITAGAFTGSLTGGRALFDLASGRPAPIPFYAELGSINPVVVTAGCGRLPTAPRWPRVWSAPSPWAPGSSAPSPGWCSCPQGAGFEAQVAEAMGGAAPRRC